MTDSPNLALPYLEAAQAQKHVTHNEALRRLDALVQLALRDRDLSTPPATPADGDRYLVATSPTGAWSGQAGKIAAWQDGAWAFLNPREGFLAYVADEDVVLSFDGTGWSPPSTSAGIGALQALRSAFAASNGPTLYDSLKIASGTYAGLTRRVAAGNVVPYFTFAAQALSEAIPPGDILAAADAALKLLTACVRVNSSAYTANQLMHLDQKLFFCNIPGTTAASPPSTSGITTAGQFLGDGTVTWEYTGKTIPAAWDAVLLNVGAGLSPTQIEYPDATDAAAGVLLAAIARAAPSAAWLAAASGHPAYATRRALLAAIAAENIANEIDGSNLTRSFQGGLAGNGGAYSFRFLADNVEAWKGMKGLGLLHTIAGDGAAATAAEAIATTLKTGILALWDAGVTRFKTYHGQTGHGVLTGDAAFVSDFRFHLWPSLHGLLSTQAEVAAYRDPVLGYTIASTPGLWAGTLDAFAIAEWWFAAGRATGAPIATDTLLWRVQSRSVANVTVIDAALVAALLEADLSDHGLLDGLGDDDHAQYHTDARGDARYDPLGTAVAAIVAHVAAGDPHAQYLTPAELDGDKGDITVSASGATYAIDADAVTNAKLANVATATLKGRVTAAAGDPEDLTGTQATTLLDAFTSGLKGLAPSSGGGTTNFLRADGTWAAPAGGGGVSDGDKGDITVSSGGTVWTIDADTVTNAKLADVPTATFKGRTTAATGDPEDLTVAQAKTLLNLTGTNSGDQTITLTGDVTGSGAGSFAATIANDAVTFAKLQNIGTDRLIGRDTAAGGDPEEISLNATLEFTGAGAIQRAALTGDVTASAGSNATTIANDAVTNAKAADVPTATFKGRTTAATGDPEDLTVAQAKTLLNLTGTNSGDQTITLTGDVTGSGAGSFAATIANDAVTNAKLANVATATLKGRVTAATGDPEDLTGTQATTLLDTFTSALKGLAPSSGGGSTNFLRADGTWAAPGGGSGSPGGADTQVQYNDGGAFGGAAGLTYNEVTQKVTFTAAETLFNHNGAGHQTTLNKAAAGDTASVLFQTGFSGRAEFGLTGDDDWHVKVSADGTAWTDALIFDRTSGAVSLPSGLAGIRGRVVAATPAANQNDYSPAGWNDAEPAKGAILRLAATASLVLTGLAGGTDGRFARIINAATDKVIVLAHENAGSTAANRFVTNGGSRRGHKVLLPGDAINLVYDGTAARWKIVSGDAGNALTSATSHTYMGPGSGTTIANYGMPATSNGGTVSHPGIATTNFHTSTRRFRGASGTTAGTQAGARCAVSTCWRGNAAGLGGFVIRAGFGYSALPSTAQASFTGLAATTGALGNVDTQTILNMIGWGNDPADTNLRLYTNDGSGAATETDLGASYPLNTTALFEGWLVAVPNGTQIAVVTARMDDLTITPDVRDVTADLPVNTTGLSPHVWICNRAAAADYQIECVRYDQWTQH